MSPDLLRYLLSGGSIPGVEQATLNEVVGNYLRQMAHAARLANEGVQDEQVLLALPSVENLPVEMLQMMAKVFSLSACDALSV